MHIASVNVRFYETDMMGIAHHSNHFRISQIGVQPRDGVPDH